MYASINLPDYTTGLGWIITYLLIVVFNIFSRWTHWCFTAPAFTYNRHMVQNRAVNGAGDDRPSRELHLTFSFSVMIVFFRLCVPQLYRGEFSTCDIRLIPFLLYKSRYVSMPNPSVFAQWCVISNTLYHHQVRDTSQGKKHMPIWMGRRLLQPAVIARYQVRIKTDGETPTNCLCD